MNKQKNDWYYKEDRPEMLKYVPLSSKKILDIGCGEGLFAKALISVDREVWGVELDSVAAKRAEQVLFRVLGGAIEDVMKDLPDQYFDLIIFNDVLEHLIDPYGVIFSIKEKLTKSGMILSSIPNLRYGKVLFNFLYKKDFTYTVFGILDITHMRFFTIRTMKDMFTNAGYKIRLMEGIHQSTSPKAFAFSLMLTILTLTNCIDILYPQFVILADKKNI